MAEDQPVRVKKIKPYPFAMGVQGEVAQLSVQVILLTLKGVIAETGQSLLKVGSRVRLAFRLPVLGSEIQCDAKVTKTTDRMLAKPAAKPEIVRTVEFHFLNLDKNSTGEIKKFISAIQQR